MLPSCSLCSTRSLTSKESEVLRAFGQITFKEIALMIPNHTARKSKKGDKAPLGQASHSSRQRLVQNALVYRTIVVLAPPVSKTENPRTEISLHPCGTHPSWLLTHLP